MFSFDTPNLNNNTLLVFIGHEALCEIKDGNHSPVDALGKSWPDVGVACIINNGTELSERKTILHEIAHWYQGEETLDHNYKLSIEEIIAGYDPDCIYGQYKSDEYVMENLLICQGCQNRIKANLSRFDHE